MMFFLVSLTAHLLTARAAFAADSGQPGGFLRQEATARGAALGAALGPRAEDSSSMYWNPAGLARMSKPELAATHVLLFEDTNYDFVSGGAPTRWGTLAAAYVRQGSGSFERRNTPFDAAAGFTVAQSAFEFGWGAALALPAAWRAGASLDVGAVVKTVKESIDATSASGNGADVGLALRPTDRLTLGLLWQNLVAPKLTFVSRPVSYPRRLEFAPSYQFTWTPHVSALALLRVSKADNESAVFSGGVELWYDKLAALRLGSQDKGPTFGVGARIANSQFDYAVLLNDLGLSHLLTFSQRFGQTPEELQETIRSGIRKQTKAEALRLSRAYMLSAELKIQKDQIAEAIQDLEAASLWDPANTAIRRRIGELEGKVEAQLTKKMTERTSLLARQQFERGNLLASRQYWNSILELDPKNEEALGFIGKIDKTLSEQERVKLNSLRKEQLEAEALSLVETGKVMAQRGRVKQALIQAEKAGVLAPWNEPVKSFLAKTRSMFRQSVKERIQEADQLLTSKEYRKALGVLEELSREDPNNEEVAERFQKAKAAVEKSLDPQQQKELERLYYRAVEKYLQGNYTEANSLIEQMTRIDPTSDWARNLKAKVDAAMKLAQ